MIISCAGKRSLDGALGTKEVERASLEEYVSRWTQEVEVLAAFAKTQPQASLAVFTHGLVGRWTYAFRVMSITTGDQLDRLEKVIAQQLMPSLTGQTALSTEMRNLLALPARFGGMGIARPTAVRDLQYEKSLATTKPPVEMILKQQGEARVGQEEVEKVQR